MKPILPSLACLAASAAAQPEVPTPAAVFGHEPGQRFTHVRQIRAWFEAAAGAARDRLRLKELGQSYGGRPLYLALLSSPANLARFDTEIAPAWRALADGTRTPRDVGALPPIVWFSYGVHGDETSASEVAPLLAYELLRPARAALLDKLVVVIDPCLNPDGRQRYVAGFEDRFGTRPDPDPAAVEHAEPWPGGRTNHYLQDLNRDWAFQTQRETRLRIAAWLEMPPQVHLDYHEMYPEDEYFFFPAQVPVNRHVSRRILDWHARFGRDNARAFDQRRWRYYSAEEFDLFYPGYGDSWPSLMGAVGMTFEVGGHGAGGLAYRRHDGSVWRLKDRIDRHLVTSLQALETTAAGRAKLRIDFHAIHREAEAWGRQQKARYLCIPAGQRRASVQALSELLRRQGIRVRMTAAPARARLADGSGGADWTPLPPRSLVVDLAQPRGRLAASLLEPDPEISHLYFYDVSAWSLPLAFGLKPAWASEIVGNTTAWTDATPASRTLPDGTVAVVVDAASGNLPALAVAAIERAVRARIGSQRFRLVGRQFSVGSLVLLPAAAHLDELATILDAFPHARVFPTASTQTERGPDLGSSSFQDLVPIRAAMAFGEGTPSATTGALWHLFDRDLEVRLTRLPHRSLGTSNLDRSNLLILPGGAVPPGLRGRENLAFLRRWLAEGGVLLAMGSSAERLYRELLGAKPPESKAPEPKPPLEWKPLESRRHERRRRSSPGSIVEVRVDPSHVLAAGYDSTLPVLVRGSSPGFSRAGPGEIVAYYGKVKRLSGYLPAEAQQRLEGTGYLLHAPIGRGAVVLFHQDPQFRLFWHGLTRMFLNAALLLPRRRVRDR